MHKNASMHHYFLVTKYNYMSVPSAGITKLKHSAVKYFSVRFWRSALQANSNLLIRGIDLLLHLLLSDRRARRPDLPSHIHHL